MLSQVTQGPRERLGDLLPQGEHLVGQRAQLIRRDAVLAEPAGDLLQAVGGGLQEVGRVGPGLPGPAHDATPACSAAIRPRIPLTSPGASAWQ